MADWKKTAKTILLADGGIDDREVAVLRKELFADGKVDDTELDFLMELKRDAKRLVPAFHFLMIESLKSCCIAGDAIKPGSANLLRRWIQPGKVGYVEKRYLEELRAAAKQVPADFNQWYRQVTAS